MSAFGDSAYGSAPIVNHEPWMAEARCRSVGVEMFFAEHPGETGYLNQAKAVCNGVTGEDDPCPVRDACLAWALRVDDRFAILGGLTARARLKLAREQAAAGVLVKRCRTCDKPFNPTSPAILDCGEVCHRVQRQRQKRRSAS